MATHVKVLGIIHIVFGALGTMGALAILAIFGGIAGLLGTDPSAHAAAPLLGGIGGIIFVIVTALSLPGLIIGIGLLNFRPWARVPGIILSAINLLNVPFGTALGIYGLWTLLNRETESLFAGQYVAGL
jgi:hypothetical protein